MQSAVQHGTGLQDVLLSVCRTEGVQAELAEMVENEHPHQLDCSGPYLILGSKPRNPIACCLSIAQLLD